MGFSSFPREITPTPRTWAASQGNVVFYRAHDKVRNKIPNTDSVPLILSYFIYFLSSPTCVRDIVQGGHFAALEQPELLLKDLEDFIAQVWQ